MKFKKLIKNGNEINSVDSWGENCKLMSDTHWKEFRSAKCLAQYFMNSYPALPNELSMSLLDFVPADTEFAWDVEKKTSLPGTGEGRNHDAVLYSDGFVATIEAKVDEPLGKTVGEEIDKASVNKLNRISKMLSVLFDDKFNKFRDFPYQLLTASVGTIIEAQKNGAYEAVLYVTAFESSPEANEKKLAENNRGINKFFEATAAYEEKNCMVIPNNSNVKLYFKKIIL